MKLIKLVFGLGVALAYVVQIVQAEKIDTNTVYFAELKTKAEQGNAASQYELGYAYYRGKLGLNEALKWFCKSADQGYAKAQGMLGFCYENGQGVETNFIEAIKWYRKAADQDDKYAQEYLGLCYAKGHGVGTNFIEAIKWYRKAGDQGNEKAQCHLAYCYAYGNGVASDGVEAYKWWFIAEKLGHGYCAANNMTMIGANLSPEQIAAAKKRANDWIFQHKKIFPEK